MASVVFFLIGPFCEPSKIEGKGRGMRQLVLALKACREDWSGLISRLVTVWEPFKRSTVGKGRVGVRVGKGSRVPLCMGGLAGGNRVLLPTTLCEVLNVGSKRFIFVCRRTGRLIMDGRRRGTRLGGYVFEGKGLSVPVRLEGVLGVSAGALLLLRTCPRGKFVGVVGLVRSRTGDLRLRVWEGRDLYWSVGG